MCGDADSGAAPGEGGMVEGEGFEGGGGFHFCRYHFGSAK